MSSCVLHYPLPQFSTLEEIHQGVITNIAYRADSKRVDLDLNPFDEWQTPEQTLRRKSGDCEDMVSLIAYLARDSLGIEISLHLMIREADGEKHMSAFDGDRYFDAPSGLVLYGDIFGFTVFEILTLEEYLKDARFDLHRSVTASQSGGEA
jgi:transglutaminase-like putative cysteine protease